MSAASAPEETQTPLQEEQLRWDSRDFALESPRKKIFFLLGLIPPDAFPAVFPSPRACSPGGTVRVQLSPAHHGCPGSFSSGSGCD